MSERRTRQSWHAIAPLALVLSGYTLLATAFAIVVPPFESPDETGHLFYVNFVATHGRLPNQDNPDQRVEGEGHQFPLYYLPAAIAVRVGLADNSVDLLPRVNRVPGQPPPNGARPKFIHIGASIFTSRSDAMAFYGLRASSIALGLVTVLLCWFVAGELLLSQGERLLATAVVATLPQFLFISASINNDNLANLLITFTILFFLRLHRDPTWFNATMLGSALGLALCAKKTALFIVPVFAVVAVLMLVRARSERRNLTARLALVPALALALSGWVFARNTRLYGEPLGSAMERRNLPQLLDEKSIFDRYWLETFVPRLGESFVGVFGWMDVPLPAPVSLFYLALLFVALPGIVCALRRDPGRHGFILAISLIAACFAGVVFYNLTYTQYQGRFTFPVISLISALCVRGWRVATDRTVLRERQFMLGCSLAAVCVGIVVYALAMLREYYTSPDNYIGS